MTIFNTVTINFQGELVGICTKCNEKKLIEPQDEIEPTSIKASNYQKQTNKESDSQLTQNQPTFHQMQVLINEIRELNAYVKILRWIIPLGFTFLIIYIKWIGVKVNVSPTVITPWLG